MKIIKEYEKYLETKTESDNTIKTYVISVNQFFTFFRNYYGEEITVIEHMHIQEFINHLKKEKYLKAITINSKLRGLSSFCSYLIKQKDHPQKEMPIHPKDYINIQKTFKKPAPVKRTIDRILNHIPKCSDQVYRDRLIIMLGSFAGLRADEIVSVELSNINLEEREIYIYGKGGKMRTVFISNKLLEYLKLYLNERKINNTYYLNKYLIIGRQTTRKDKQMNRNVVNRLLTKVCNSMEIEKIEPHDLRRFFVTNTKENSSLELSQIQDIVGHDDINTTNQYFRISKEKILKELDISQE